MDVSLGGRFQRTYEKHRDQKLKMFTSDFTAKKESTSCEPKAPHKATHYVKEKLYGGQMHFLSTSEIIQDIETRFVNLSLGAKAEYNGIGVQNEIGGQVQNGRHNLEAEGLLACYSTVGDFFSYDECTKESLGKKLQNIPVENLQPKEIILEPLPLPLVLSNMDDSQQMQQCIQTKFQKLTKTLTELERLLKLTRDSAPEDGVKNMVTRDSGLVDGVEKILDLKEEIENSSETILQDIKTLYHHKSSREERLRASTRLLELDCETAGSKLKKLREHITKTVLHNLIPRELARPKLSGACGKQDYRVAIIGKTGSGKSSLANYIVGKDRFKVGFSAERVTTTYASELVEIEGKRVNVYDTPGFYDPDKKNKLARKQALLAQKHGQGSGFDAFFFVVTYDGAANAKNVFRVIKDLHGDDIKHYTILVFNRMKGNVDDLINNSTEFKEIYEKVGHRVIGVRCGNWRDLLDEERTQTCRKLLEMIQLISREQKGKRFETGMKNALLGFFF